MRFGKINRTQSKLNAVKQQIFFALSECQRQQLSLSGFHLKMVKKTVKKIQNNFSFVRTANTNYLHREGFCEYLCSCLSFFSRFLKKFSLSFSVGVMLGTRNNLLDLCDAKSWF